MSLIDISEEANAKNSQDIDMHLLNSWVKRNLIQLLLLSITITLLSFILLKMPFLKTIPTRLLSIFCINVLVFLFACLQSIEFSTSRKKCRKLLCALASIGLLLILSLGYVAQYENKEYALIAIGIWSLVIFIWLPFLQLYIRENKFPFDYSKLAFLAWQNFILVCLALLNIALFYLVILTVQSIVNIELNSEFFKWRTLDIFIYLLPISMLLASWVVRFKKTKVNTLIHFFYATTSILLPVINGFIMIMAVMFFKALFQTDIQRNMLLFLNVCFVVMSLLLLISAQSFLSCDIKPNKRLNKIFPHLFFMIGISILTVYSLRMIYLWLFEPNLYVQSVMFFIFSVLFAILSLYVVTYFIVSLPFLWLCLKFACASFRTESKGVAFGFKKAYLSLWMHSQNKFHFEKINMYYALLVSLLLLAFVQPTLNYKHIVYDSIGKFLDRQTEPLSAELYFQIKDNFAEETKDMYDYLTQNNVRFNEDFRHKINVFNSTFSAFNTIWAYETNQSLQLFREQLKQQPIDYQMTYFSPSVTISHEAMIDLRVDLSEFGNKNYSYYGSGYWEHCLLNEANSHIGVCGFYQRDELSKDGKPGYLLVHYLNELNFYVINFNRNTKRYESVYLSALEINDELKNIMPSLNHLETQPELFFKSLEQGLDIEKSEAELLLIENTHFILNEKN